MRIIAQKPGFLRALACISILMTSLSFSPAKGGEGFEIYLNNKLVLQQFGSKMNSVQNIRLDQSLSNAQMAINYFHCGRAGKNRSITIKNDHNRILKEWKFADVSTASISISGAAMNCRVSDILNLQKNNPGKLNLYYSSAELPSGRLLVSLVTGDMVKAK
jgi:hypothetical protein